MKKLFLPAIIILSLSLNAQFYSGEIGFSYLNIPVSPLSQAFSTAGSAATGRYGDMINPASLSDAEGGGLFSVNYMNYIAGSHFGLFSYSFGQSQIYLKYFNSGLIERRDSLNTDLGTYSANVAIVNFSHSFSLSEKMKLGAGASIGFENITEYNGAAGTVDIGFIYKNIYSDFLSAGIDIMNLGAVYDFDEISVTPARIIAGIAIGKDDMPFAVYVDAGKILDSKYFYAAGMEFFLVKPVKTEVVPLTADFSMYQEVPQISDTSAALISPVVDSLLSDSALLAMPESPTEISADTTMKTDTTALQETAEAAGEEEYKSYADYLDEETKKEENAVQQEIQEADTSAKTEIVAPVPSPKPTARKKGVLDPLAFSFRWGFSSDRTNLQMGYGSDIFAGLTAGFRISYDRIRMDYSAKMWGQLGVSQSFGLGFTF